MYSGKGLTFPFDRDSCARLRGFGSGPLETGMFLDPVRDEIGPPSAAVVELVTNDILNFMDQGCGFCETW